MKRDIFSPARARRRLTRVRPVADLNMHRSFPRARNFAQYQSRFTGRGALSVHFFSLFFFLRRANTGTRGINTRTGYDARLFPIHRQ